MNFHEFIYVSENSVIGRSSDFNKTEILFALSYV